MDRQWTPYSKINVLFRFPHKPAALTIVKIRRKQWWQGKGIDKRQDNCFQLKQYLADTIRQMLYYRKKTRVKSLIGLAFSSWYFLELFALWMHANQLHLTWGFVLKTWLILGFETQLSVDSILELTLNHCIEDNLWGGDWKTHPCY